MQPPQPGTGLDAELLDQDVTAFPEHGQGIRLPPAPVQCQHQLAAEPFPERMLPHQAGQLGRRFRGAAQHEHDLGPLLERRQPHLAEADPLDLGPRTGELRQQDRMAQPERSIE